MYLALNKQLLWVVAIWFALLQTISPFIHAHIEADSPMQSHGLHIHEPILMTVQDSRQTVNSAHAVMHTIGVNKALMENADILPLPLFALLFLLSFLALNSRLAHASFTAYPFSRFHLRPQSGPRAPPFLK